MKERKISLKKIVACSVIIGILLVARFTVFPEIFGNQKEVKQKAEKIREELSDGENIQKTKTRLAYTLPLVTLQKEKPPEEGIKEASRDSEKEGDLARKKEKSKKEKNSAQEDKEEKSSQKEDTKGKQETRQEEKQTCAVFGCPEGTLFVGSKNSDVYHQCHCSNAKRISPANLRCFDTAPPERRPAKKC